MNILLVDDETYMIESISKNVDWSRIQAVTIYTANSMRQAMAIMEMIAIEVIVCDIVMPEGSGFDFME